jgi:addiction module HigA family antidote
MRIKTAAATGKTKKQLYANNSASGTALHPGVLLKEELNAREMTQQALADQLDIAKNVLSEIITGKRNITATLAIKLEVALKIDAEFWMKLQASYELDKIRIFLRKEKKR